MADDTDLDKTMDLDVYEEINEYFKVRRKHTFLDLSILVRVQTALTPDTCLF
jgi:hypothetical protein